VRPFERPLLVFAVRFLLFFFKAMRDPVVTTNIRMFSKLCLTSEAGKGKVHHVHCMMAYGGVEVWMNCKAVSGLACVRATLPRYPFREGRCCLCNRSGIFRERINLLHLPRIELRFLPCRPVS
jgi:hypothetical protein